MLLVSRLGLVLLIFVSVVPAVVLHTYAQGGSATNNTAFLDPSTRLKFVDTGLSQIMKDIQSGNSQAALAHLNMTKQQLIAAELQLNATVICENTRNEGFCSTG